MGEFEVLERDGLARLGRLETPHGPILTPALLPVVHPEASRQPVSPTDLRRRFGFGAVITSSYITFRTPPLRARAEEVGIHGLLGFDGPVMTDSGAFQQHAYGHVEVGPEEILGFQRRIGSDIATVLDIFVEPGATLEEATAGVEETIRRAKAARELHRGLLAVPVQGGLVPELRLRSASEASEVGDVLAVGGVVPLMEQYRFADLARAVLAARPGLAPERVVHLFGTGHPMTFAFAALLGVDLFDSSAYQKFARRGGLLFANGTVNIDGIREPFCRCALCHDHPLTEVARLSAAERERRIAEHNLLMCSAEVAEVRQAIRDGSLWELAERRASAHPALLAGLKAMVRGVRVFLPSEPESRSSYRYCGPTSGLRPAAIRFLARLERWKAGKAPFLSHPLVPLLPGRLARTPTEDRSGRRLRWEAVTSFGAVPLELTELYPVGCYVGPDEFDDGPTRRRPMDASAVPSDLDGVEFDHDADWGAAWELRYAESILEFHYGADAARNLVGQKVHVERSRRTGRFRALHHGDDRSFIIGPDGVPRPTWKGAQLLHAALPGASHRLRVASDAVDFVRGGKSLFSRFVAGGDPTLVPGASALLVDESDQLLAVGRLVLAPYEMGRLTRGVAARVTTHARRSEEPPEESGDEPDVGGAPPSDVR